MNRSETAAILGVISAIDPKVPAPDEDVLDLWAGLLDDVPAGTAGEAVRAYYRSERYAQTRESISPGDLVGHWRRKRREDAERRHNAQLRAHHRRRPLDDRQLCTIRNGVDQVAATLAISKGADPEHAEADAHARRAVLAVPCPYCKARPGDQCLGPGGRPLTRQPAHPSRLDAAFATT
ncbi:replicative helicase loader/inhibitor [Saccharopolyspora shandongensis]|uniref:zinc finger domain-containing protein n=1 Tax=Saccharopolyspora shandongensis TaxID=418495 RepID=UPI003432A313